MINQHNTIIPADCILIHTDGSCIGNPGPGGWAASLRRISGGVEVKKQIVKGRAPATTNNRMELLAALEALKCLRLNESSTIIFRSDNQYLIKGMTEWTTQWLARGWLKTDGKAAENQDLWKELVTIATGWRITWCWVRGRIGGLHKEEVHVIATSEARAMQRII